VQDGAIPTVPHVLTVTFHFPLSYHHTPTYTTRELSASSGLVGVTSLATMDAFVQEAFTLLGIGLFVIGLRLYVRISSSGIRRLHADDYLMIVAAVSTPKSKHSNSC
jgi:hypothetical protein